MELKGKKIAFLGDSITEGYGASCEENTYWNLIARKTGAECFGYGIGGTTIARRQKPLPNEKTNRYFGSRVHELIPDADIVVIFGGTNDFGGSDPAFGQMSDRTDDTFYGAYHLLLQALIRKYPTGKILVATPLHRLTEDDPSYNEQDGRRGGRLSDYVDAICQVAAFYGIAVADLYRTCPIQPRMEDHRIRYMPDGVHPNDAGHVILADSILRALMKL